MAIAEATAHAAMMATPFGRVAVPIAAATPASTHCSLWRKSRQAAAQTMSAAEISFRIRREINGHPLISKYFQVATPAQMVPDAFRASEFLTAAQRLAACDVAQFEREAFER